MDQHLLSIVLLTPLAGLAVLLLIPGKSKECGCRSRCLQTLAWQ